MTIGYVADLKKRKKGTFLQHGSAFLLLFFLILDLFYSPNSFKL